MSDELTPNAVGISCYSTYCHAPLLGLADPPAMSIRQIELTDRWLSQWARKVFPMRNNGRRKVRSVLVDLDGRTGATLAAAAPGSPPRSMRFCYPGKLATSVRGRLKRLAAGTSPAELQLGHDLSVEICTALLSHLDAHWHQLPRAKRRQQSLVARTCDGGRPGCLFPCRRPHVRSPGSAGTIDVPGCAIPADVGALTDYDRHREEAERNWPWERWQGPDEWREAVLSRNDGGRYRWFLTSS